MTQASTSNSATPRKRPWGKYCRRSLLILALALIGLYWLASSSFLTRRVVMGALSDIAGPDTQVTASSVTVTATGRIDIQDLSIRVKDVAGDAGEVFAVKRVFGRVGLIDTIRGKPTVHSLSLIKPIARLSRSRDDGSLNINSMVNRPASAGGTAIAQLPAVEVADGVIELSEHSAGDPSYTVLKHLTISGTVEQSADDQGASVINFRQATSATGQSTIALGRISKDAVTLTVTGIDLGAVNADNVPVQARELFSQTKLEGRIPQAQVSYAFAGDWSTTISLEDVALNLPIDALPDEDAEGNAIPVPDDQKNARLRIKRTTGTISLSNVGVKGNLDGQIEALPYHVEFRVDGLSLNAPWTISLNAKDVPIHEQPEILKFAPGVARRRLREFSDPQGKVDASVDLSRGAITQAQSNPPLKVVGSISLKGLTAAFHKFPYPWQDLTGTVTFDDNSINIHEVRGRSASGGTITASGSISPPTDDAEVRLDVRALGLPIDDRLRSAMRERGQGDVLDEMFSLSDYDRLLKANLVRDPSSRTEREANSPPDFALGGTVNVRVLIGRELGSADTWTDRIEIELPKAGVLVRAFPYPLIAHNVQIVQENGVATVSGGTYEGLSGGTGSVAARVDIDAVRTSGDFVPELQATAKDIPIDAILMSALPDVGPDDARRPLSNWIKPLNPSGAITADVDLKPSMAGPVYDIKVKAAGTLKAIGDGSGAGTPVATDKTVSPNVEVSNFASTIQVTDRFVKLDATGDAHLSVPNSPSYALGAHLYREIGAESAFVSTRESAHQALTIRVPKFDLALPVENFVRGYSERAAEAIIAAREQVSPIGLASCDLRIGLSPTDSGTVDVEVANFSNAFVTYDGLKLSLDPKVPQFLRVQSEEDASGTTTVAANYLFSGTLDNLEIGRLRAEGTILQSANAPRIDAVTLRARDISLEEPAVRELLSAKGSQKLVDVLEKYDVSGIVDADLSIATQDQSTRVEGTVRPTALAWTAHDENCNAVRVDFPFVSGQVRLAPAASRPGEVSPSIAGQVESLALFHRDWKALLSGTWSPAETIEGTQVDGEFTLAAPSLLPSLKALLPTALSDSMKELKTTISGPITIAQSPVSFVLTPQGEPLNVSTTGTLVLSDLALDMGFAVTNAEGILDYRFTSEDTPGSGRALMTGDFLFLRANNVELTNATIKLFTEPDGRVIIPTLEAQCHGGRIIGNIDIASPNTPGALAGATPTTSQRPFDLNLSLSGVRFAPVLEQLRSKGQPGEDDVGNDLTPALPDASRGAITGSFSMRGILNERGTQRGRGTLMIQGGNILDLPTVVPLVRVTNLQFPTNEKLDYASTDFFIQGEQLGLEQITISSPSVEIFGFGTATWPTLDLDLKLRTGNRSRIPLITTLVEQLRDELSAIRVVGPINNPKVDTVRFGGTREAIANLFGKEKSAEERRLEMIERSLSTSERRERIETLPPIAPTTTSDATPK
ncbi:MAG: hypothetical protein U0640_03030 [Phycisphaerales bacterium]